jgi:hypothetical protein
MYKRLADSPLTHFRSGIVFVCTDYRDTSEYMKNNLCFHNLKYEY